MIVGLEELSAKSSPLTQYTVSVNVSVATTNQLTGKFGAQWSTFFNIFRRFIDQTTHRMTEKIINSEGRTTREKTKSAKPIFLENGDSKSFCWWQSVTNCFVLQGPNLGWKYSLFYDIIANDFDLIWSVWDTKKKSPILWFQLLKHEYFLIFCGIFFYSMKVNM